MSPALTHIYVSTGSYETAFVGRNAAALVDELLGYGAFSHLHVIFFRADRDRYPVEVRSDITAWDVAFPGQARLVAQVRFLTLLLGLAARSRPCVLTAADPFLPAIEVALAAARHRVPWVQYVGIDFEGMWRMNGVRLGRFLPGGRRVERLVEKLALRRADRVRTWNRFYRDYAVAMGASPIRCVALPPSPFNDAYYEPEAHASARRFIGGDEPLFCAVQRLDAGKKSVELVDVFALLRARLPGARLVFAGEGALRPVIEERARRLGVAEAVELAGHLALPDLIALMLRADVLLGGHSGRALMEAALCGLEVVAFDYHWHREGVELLGYGRVTPFDDTAAMAASAVALYEDRRRDPGRRAAVQARAAGLLRAVGQRRGDARLLPGASRGARALRSGSGIVPGQE